MKFILTSVLALAVSFASVSAFAQVPPQPLPKRKLVACPAGSNERAWVQTATYVSAPAPTYWVLGPYLPETAPNNACTPLNAPPVEHRLVACPAGSVQPNWIQTRTYTAVPAPTYWSPTDWLPTTPPLDACTPQ